MYVIFGVIGYAWRTYRKTVTGIESHAWRWFVRLTDPRLEGSYYSITIIIENILRLILGTFLCESWLSEEEIKDSHANLTDSLEHMKQIPYPHTEIRNLRNYNMNKKTMTTEIQKDLNPSNNLNPFESPPAYDKPLAATESKDGVESLASLATSLGLLLEEKNKAYGSSFDDTGSFLKLLYPQGIEPDQYGDALALVRIFDKMKRIATNKDAMGESPFQDLAGYGILGLRRTLLNRQIEKNNK